MKKRPVYTYPRMNISVHPILHRRFKEICEREGVPMSKRIGRWIREYVAEHEEGNPQAKLVLERDLTLVDRAFEEPTEMGVPAKEGRRKRIEILELNLKRYPGRSHDVCRAFMKKTGLKARTVEEYMRLLGRPVKLTPGRKKRSY